MQIQVLFSGCAGLWIFVKTILVSQSPPVLMQVTDVQENLSVERAAQTWDMITNYNILYNMFLWHPQHQKSMLADQIVVGTLQGTLSATPNSDSYCRCSIDYLVRFDKNTYARCRHQNSACRLCQYVHVHSRWTGEIMILVAALLLLLLTISDTTMAHVCLGVCVWA